MHLEKAGLAGTALLASGQGTHGARWLGLPQFSLFSESGRELMMSVNGSC